MVLCSSNRTFQFLMDTKKVENCNVDWDEAVYRGGYVLHVRLRIMWGTLYVVLHGLLTTGGFQHGDTGTAESSANYAGFTHDETIWQISKNGIRRKHFMLFSGSMTIFFPKGVEDASINVCSPMFTPHPTTLFNLLRFSQGRLHSLFNNSYLIPTCTGWATITWRRQSFI